MSIRLSSLAIQIDAIGVDKVKSALREVSDEGVATSRHLRLISSDVGAVGDKYGGVARGVARFADQIAESGKVSGRSLRSLLGEVGSVAGAFGPYGALVSAVAIGGAAIYHLFQRTREEIVKTQTTFQQNLDQMVNAGDAAGLTKQLRDLYRGTPAKNFEDALKPKLDKIAELKSYRSSMGEGKIWLGLGAKKAYEELMADENVKNYFTLVAAIVNPKNAPLPDMGLTTVTTHGKAAASAESIEAALTKRIDILTKGLIFDDQRARITVALTGLEKQLTVAVNSGTLSLEARTRAALHLAEIEAALARKFAGARATSAAGLIGITGTGETAGGAAQDAYGGPMANVKARATPELDEYKARILAAAKPLEEAIASIARTVRGGLATTLGEAIYQGFSAAFSGKGLSGMFKSFGKTVLAGIGQIFGQLGQIWLVYGLTMFKLGAFLWNPATAGWAALAIGASLIAMSAALGAAGNSGGGAGGGIGGGSYVARPDEITNIKLTATSVADQARYDPNARGNQFIIIGTNDPRAQRELADMVAKGGRR